MLDGNTAALREYEREQSRLYDNDLLMERTAEEMAEQLLDGETIRCVGRWSAYDVSFADFVLSLEESGELPRLYRRIRKGLSASDAFRHLRRLLTDFCYERADDRANYLRD